MQVRLPKADIHIEPRGTRRGTWINKRITKILEDLGPAYYIDPREFSTVVLVATDDAVCTVHSLTHHCRMSPQQQGCSFTEPRPLEFYLRV